MIVIDKFGFVLKLGHMLASWIGIARFGHSIPDARTSNL